ncbi:MAG: class I SAM-dependent methyltransferase [Nitrospirota bacterium]
MSQDVSRHVLFRSRLIDSLAKRALLKQLKGIRHGTIVLKDEGQRYEFGSMSAICGLSATITVTDNRFYRSIALGGSIGAAESYMAGYWQCDNITNLIRIMICNQDIVSGIESGLSTLMNIVHNTLHRKRRNSLGRSASNVSAHYDIGNEFFQLFLDETMTYSCGIFRSNNETMSGASLAKYDHLCRKIALQSTDHIVEIGSGWGGFAIYAASSYGCQVTTITISKSQYELALERIQQAGLHDRITILLQDYREIQGKFNKLVSIEMVEAVGHEYLETFFSCCSNLLRNDGIAALQAITMNDQMYDDHVKTVDFIRRYIFPGGCVPSVTRLCNAASTGSDLRLIHLEDLTPHYPKTLKAWRSKLLSSLDDILSLGYSDQFIRMWEFYFCYCEAGFTERYISDVQLLFAKPGWRGSTLFSLDRE